jgi:hypothetical protein
MSLLQKEIFPKEKEQVIAFLKQLPNEKLISEWLLIREENSHSDFMDLTLFWGYKNLSHCSFELFYEGLISDELYRRGLESYAFSKISNEAEEITEDSGRVTKKWLLAFNNYSIRNN